MSKEESKFQLPPMHHIGLVVKDVDKAVEHYTKIGLGPFQVFEREFPDFIYQGRPTYLRTKFGFNAGPPRIELLEEREGETPNADFLRKKGEGIVHLGFFVDVNDFEGMLANLKREGFNPVFQRTSAEQPVAYLNTDEIGGVMIELIGEKKD